MEEWQFWETDRLQELHLLEKDAYTNRLNSGTWESSGTPKSLYDIQYSSVFSHGTSTRTGTLRNNNTHTKSEI